MPGPRWAVLTALLALGGCSGCDDDSRVLVSRCTSGPFAQGETCTWTLQVLEKRYTHRQWSDLIKQARAVTLDATVTVQQGEVRAFFEDGQRERHEVVVKPGAPGKLQGAVAVGRPAGSSDRANFSVDFDPVGGAAQGVAVQLNWSVGP